MQLNRNNRIPHCVRDTKRDTTSCSRHQPRNHIISETQPKNHIMSETPTEKPPHHVRDTKRETTSCPRHQSRNHIMSETRTEKPHRVGDTDRETTSCPRHKTRKKHKHQGRQEVLTHICLVDVRPYQLDESIFHLRDVWGSFYVFILFRIDSLVSKQRRP